MQEETLTRVLAACEAEKPVAEAISAYISTHILIVKEGQTAHEKDAPTLTFEKRTAVLSDKRLMLLP